MPPILVLPVVLAASDVGTRQTLGVGGDDGWLHIELASDGPPPVRLPEIGAMHERLQSLYGGAARLRPASQALAWTIELPPLVRNVE